MSLIGYGTPEESELIVQSNVIKASLIDIAFVHNGRTIKKRLPPTMLIQKIIMLAQRLYNLPERPTVSYVSGSQSNIEIDLTDELKEFGYYAIQDGDMLVVRT